MFAGHPIAVAAVLLAAPAALAQGQVHSMHEPPPDAAAAGEPGHAEHTTRTVAVSIYDYYFEPDSVTAEAGETVRFEVTNRSESVHEFNIGTAAMHRAHGQEMAMLVDHGVIDVDRINRYMMNMEMGVGHVMSYDYPNAVLLEPGDSGTVIWKFSGDAALEFACNIPGHYDAGMTGEIAVAHGGHAEHGEHAEEASHEHGAMGEAGE